MKKSQQGNYLSFGIFSCTKDETVIEMKGRGRIQNV